jgi:hypothetical protein
MSSMNGGCLCGAVRVVAELDNTDHSACHCAMCRRWSGGAPFFGTRARSVTFEGNENISRYESSSWAERGFCKTCGTSLFYFLKPRQAYMMSVGSFDDSSSFRLGREIFVDQKPEGYTFAGEHPKLTESETIASFAPKT